MTATYWEIGRRIVEQELREEARANYGEQLLETTCQRLDQAFAGGFGNINLWRCEHFTVLVRGADSFDTVERILQVASLHNISPHPQAFQLFLPASLCPGRPTFATWRQTPEARVFYERSSPLWMVCPSLDRQIAANSTNASRSHRTKPPCWRRPRLPNQRRGETRRSIRTRSSSNSSTKDEYSESDWKRRSPAPHRLSLELGDDFAFLGRQRRLRIDDTWFRIDLIFFHRRLRTI